MLCDTDNIQIEFILIEFQFLEISATSVGVDKNLNDNAITNVFCSSVLSVCNWFLNSSCLVSEKINQLHLFLVFN